MVEKLRSVLGVQQLGALGNKSIPGVLVDGITPQLKCMGHGYQPCTIPVAPTKLVTREIVAY